MFLLCFGSRPPKTNYTTRNWYSFILLALCLTSIVACPKKCICNNASKIVHCSRKGWRVIPDGIPANSMQLIFNGNVFENGAIQRSNFSRYTDLEHLYLSECGIEIIMEDTFIDLVKLKWLDLSNNQITVLQDYSFRGLNLMHLFLNGNRNIQISGRAFEGLVTTGLYLHECALQNLNVEVLLPLNSTLRSLWLNGNELEKLDKKFLALFSSLSHLRIGSNPLHCNCEVLWLKEFYDTHGATFKGASAPTCLTPQKLKGKQFDEMTLFQFRCRSPTFSNIDAVFNNLQGRLRCTAEGDPAPTIYWIQPTGQSYRYNPPDDDEAIKNEGVLILKAEDVPKADLTGQYFCIAINEAGNVTLTLNASWPHVRPEKEIIYKTITQPPQVTESLHTPSTTIETAGYLNDVNTQSPFYGNNDRDSDLSIRPVPSNPRNPIAPEWDIDSPYNNEDFIDSSATSNTNNNDINKNPTKKGDAYNLTALNISDLKCFKTGRYFNVTELVGAIIGTHVCTLLLCLIFMPLYYKRKRRLERERHRTLEKPPNETLYLNGLGQHHTYQDYLDTPTPTKR